LARVGEGGGDLPAVFVGAAGAFGAAGGGWLVIAGVGVGVGEGVGGEVLGVGDVCEGGLDGGGEEESAYLVEGFADGDVAGCGEGVVLGQALGVDEHGVSAAD